MEVTAACPDILLKFFSLVYSSFWTSKILEISPADLKVSFGLNNCYHQNIKSVTHKSWSFKVPVGKVLVQRGKEVLYMPQHSWDLGFDWNTGHKYANLVLQKDPSWSDSQLAAHWFLSPNITIITIITVSIFPNRANRYSNRPVVVCGLRKSRCVTLRGQLFASWPQQLAELLT